ncbi:hypothetical protein AC1031_003538 [Aphanomyces cochlioides]|nr:hypothetical protein AC1031_003538 [Aphanomyces cochlioides]
MATNPPSPTTDDIKTTEAPPPSPFVLPTMTASFALSSTDAVSSKIEVLKIESATFLAASQAMFSQVNEWEQREKQWKELEARIAFNIANAPNVVTLDVGGTIFKTTKDILLRFEDSYFHVLLGSGVWKPDSAGTAYFIDLDPATFQYIMVYLRTGDLPFDELQEWEQKQLRRSLDYLSIEVPAEVPSNKWTWDPSHCSSTLALSENNRVVQVLGLNPFMFGPPSNAPETWMAVLGNTSVVSFTVRVESGALPCIGFASREGFLAGPRESTRASSKYYFFIDMKEAIGYGSGGNKKFSPSHQFVHGDKLTVRCSDGKINFEQNGKPLGISGVPHPSSVLFPVIYFRDTGKHPRKKAVMGLINMTLSLSIVFN